MSTEGTIKPMITLQEIAAGLCISARGVWRLVARGELPKPRKVGKASRWFVSDVVEYQEKLKNSR